MKLELRPITVETGSPDEVGCLVMAGDRLVALLVQLEQSHGELGGAWALEWIAGSTLVLPPPFEHLEAAQRWIERNVPILRAA